ncbi:MAG: ATP-binding protein [Candidatus Hydrogenedentes bacterium]|nr:ATP-binding protein [FCB group bacterium]NLT62194.1 ATP-binding protein [Candidatus Hydrogenedentota bacterium]HNV20057.1 ATP-binding protein [Candidatus Hydrogenedentota bacterium]HNZ20240.1 ATP-binding protein [Candidatus Hydrogenedentota bacterium]HOH33480.1 ATP-binding protein [Candidatus Hydrogenedentota bacterium]
MSLQEREIRFLIRQKIADGLAASVPAYTRRDITLSKIRGKAKVVVGMRRSGKTTFLWQCLAERLAAGTPRDGLLYFSFEDERLMEMMTGDLQSIVEEYFSLHPECRDREPVTFFLDEIQLAPGWEKFTRRLMDTEQIDLFLSGSSARLLSREVATSMRGRGIEVLVHPFSFREFLRHRGMEPGTPWSTLPKAERSSVEKHFRDYLAEGGFPETQGLASRDRNTLLRTYVDVATLRDVVERHGVTNLTALRWMQRHLLGNPASSFSIQKFHDTLRSQGVSVGKNTLHEYLAHLEDAFLIRTISLHTASERQRMVNPRKAYPVDPGLIALYERTGRKNLGRALETAILIELERRGCEIGYVRTREGHEVDFVAEGPDGETFLIQSSAHVEEPGMWEREVRALVSASADYPEAVPLLLTYDSLPPRETLPAPIRWLPASAWLLGEEVAKTYEEE